ncbi:hypothetical protein [Microbacterium sp.]|uniref:hypothetical protein n=1 Tax=Microbacterium sp. TaxID=51671 RepID=UPI0025F21433|nr:hypothetical protein [Microbacterium sp.]
MVTLLLDSTQLDVVLSAGERALSRRKSDVRVERSHIQKVQLVDDAWTWLRGVPRPGTLVRGVLAMGTWKSAAGDDFVVVRRRHPAVVIDLEADPEFERIVLTTRNGLALVRALRLETDDQPLEVTEIVTAALPVIGGRRAPTANPRPALARLGVRVTDRA